eukprot:m.554 g.554  ORF g.554 m.554 type:complete len:391 (-) comp224_c0_seq1:89-1261(-)
MPYAYVHSNHVDGATAPCVPGTCTPSTPSKPCQRQRRKLPATPSKRFVPDGDTARSNQGTGDTLRSGLTHITNHQPCQSPSADATAAPVTAINQCANPTPTTQVPTPTPKPKFKACRRLTFPSKADHQGVSTSYAGGLAQRLASAAGQTGETAAHQQLHATQSPLSVPRGRQLGLTQPQAQEVLFKLCRTGDLGQLRRVLDDSAAGDVALTQARWHCGKTPLHVAAEYGHLRVVRWLLVHAGSRADVEVADDGSTVLHAAARGGSLAVLQWLLNHRKQYTGLPWHAKDKSGRTPLHLAASYGHLTMVQWLVSCRPVTVDAGLERTTSAGNTPLMAAATMGQADVVAFFLTATDARIVTQNMFGDTAVSLAIANNHYNVVGMLLEKAIAMA